MREAGLNVSGTNNLADPRVAMEEEERNMIDYEIPDPAGKYNGLLGLGDENNLGDEEFLLADTWLRALDLAGS